MATDHSQNMDVVRQAGARLGRPAGARARQPTTVSGLAGHQARHAPDRLAEPDGTPYTLTGADGVDNGEALRREAAAAAQSSTRRKVPSRRRTLWWSRLRQRLRLPADEAGTTSTSPCPSSRRAGGHAGHADASSRAWDIEWDFDYGFVLTTTDGGKTYTSLRRRRTATRPTGRRRTRTGNGCQAQYGNGITGTQRLLRGRHAGRSTASRGNYPRRRRSSTTPTTSRDLAGKPSRRCASPTRPTRASRGRAGSSTTSRSRPATQRRSTRRDFETRRRRPARLQRRLPATDLQTAPMCTHGWQYVAADAELARRPRLLPGDARPLRLRRRRPRRGRPRPRSTSSPASARLHRRGPRLRQRRHRRPAGADRRWTPAASRATRRPNLNDAAFNAAGDTPLLRRGRGPHRQLHRTRPRRTATGGSTSTA